MSISALFTHFDVQFPENTQDRLKWAKKVLVVSAVVATLAISTFYAFSASNKAFNTAITLTATAKSGHDVLTGWFYAGGLYGASIGLGASTYHTLNTAKEHHMFKVVKHEKDKTLDFLAAHLKETLFITTLAAGVSSVLSTQYGFFARLLNK